MSTRLINTLTHFYTTVTKHSLLTHPIITLFLTVTKYIHTSYPHNFIIIIAPLITGAATCRSRMSPAACNLLLNAQSVDGDSALSIASAKGHADVVSALLMVPPGIAIDLNLQGWSPSFLLY